MDQDEEPDLIRSFGGSSTCGFCTQDVLEGTGIVIKACLHTLCQYCIEEVIMGSTSEIVNCIVYEDGRQKCSGALLHSEIKAILPDEAYNLYMARIGNKANEDIRKSSNFYKCANANCDDGFILDDNVFEFVCPGCLFHTCIICQCTTNRPPGTQCEGVCDNFFNDNHQPTETFNTQEPKRKSKKRPYPHSEQTQPTIVKKPVIDPKFAFSEEVKKDFMYGWDQIMEKIGELPSPSSVNETEKVVEFINRHELLENLKEFECMICLTEIPAGDGVILKDCFHIFCKICLSSLIENCEEAKVNCPFQTNGYSCSDFIQDREIRALVSPEIFEKHIGRSLNKAELANRNAFHCKTVDCNYWCEVDVIDEKFTCPNCNKINCIKCKANHENVSCDVYKAKIDEEEYDPKSRDAIAKMINSGNAKRCPNCRVIIEKNGGCNHMKCKICNFDFNWVEPKTKQNGPGSVIGAPYRYGQMERITQHQTNMYQRYNDLLIQAQRLQPNIPPRVRRPPLQIPHVQNLSTRAINREYEAIRRLNAMMSAPAQNFHPPIPEYVAPNQNPTNEGFPDSFLDPNYTGTLEPSPYGPIHPTNLDLPYWPYP